MEIQTNGGDDFRQLAARFRKAGQNGAAIRKELTKTIQARLKVIVNEQKREALNMSVKGTQGRGTARREAFTAARQARKKRPRKIAGGHGLRASTARGIKSKVAYTGFKIGARISVDPSAMPRSQRTLPRRLDNPRGWRHPVWGHRDRWVPQVGEPYFTRPIERHRDQVRRDVRDAVNEVMRKLK